MLGKAEVAFSQQFIVDTARSSRAKQTQVNTIKQRYNILHRIIAFVWQLSPVTYDGKIIGAAVFKTKASVIKPAIEHMRLSGSYNIARNYNSAPSRTFGQRQRQSKQKLLKY